MEDEIIEVTLNDRISKKIKVKCYTSDTIWNLKQIAAAHLGTKPEKIKLQTASVVYKDPITLDDYEIKDGMGLELYYN